MLIARYLPILKIYRLKSSGNRALSGNVLNIAQDIQEMVNILPRALGDTSILLIRRTMGDDGQSYKDFKVNAQYMFNWLTFLKAFNPAYFDITIRPLTEIYPDGNIFNDIMRLNLYGNRVESDEDDEDYGAEMGPIQESLDDDNIVTTGVSAAVNSINETINEGSSIIQTINWPTGGMIPLNEYDRPYLLTRSFPCLFPYGRGDCFTRSYRRIAITLNTALQHY